MYVNTCALNLFQQTLLEYQLVLGITLNTEEGGQILVLRELDVWSYSYSLKVSDTEYYKIQAYFSPKGQCCALPPT